MVPRDLDWLPESNSNDPITDDARPPESLQVGLSMYCLPYLTIVEVCIDRARVLNGNAQPCGVSQLLVGGIVVCEQQCCLCNTELFSTLKLYRYWVFISVCMPKIGHRYSLLYSDKENSEQQS